MYKRVEKRRRKQLKEEELGLTEDMKEVLGMHDTDSDESDSSSSSGPSEPAGDSDEDLEMDAEDSADDEVPKDRTEKPSSRKRLWEVDEGSEDEDEGSEGEDEGGKDEEDENEDEDEGDEKSDEGESIDHDRPSISVTEAIRDPIYTIPSESNSDLKRCVVCPGKDLKNDKMAEIHRASKAHYRRFSRFIEFAGTADPETDVKEFWDFLNKPSQPNISEKNKLDADGKVELSKRAQKRKEKLDAIKVKRARAKKAKAHSIAKRQAAKEAKLVAAQEGESGATSIQPQGDPHSKPSPSESPSTTKRKSKSDGKMKGKKVSRHGQGDSAQAGESTPVSVPTPEKPPKKKQKVEGGLSIVPPANAPSTTTPALEMTNTPPPQFNEKSFRTKPSNDPAPSTKKTKTVKAHSSSKFTITKPHKALASHKSRSLGSSRTKKPIAS